MRNPWVVIGAGQAGLAAGYHLKRAGLDFAILEGESQPGGSWPQYYDSLTLFSPASRSSLPGMPFPGDRDHYPGRDEVTAYLRQYAGHFALPIITDARVVRVEQEAAGFTAIDLEITRQYTIDDIPASATGWAAGLDEASRVELVGRFASTFVRATKPAPTL